MIRLITMFILVACAPAATTRAEEPLPLFEGEVTYRIELEPRHPDLTIEYLQSQFGTGFKMILKNGDYTFKYEGGLIDRVWFKVQEKREYSLMRGENFLRVADTRGIVLEPSRLDHLSGKRKILDYDAKPLMIQFKDGSRTIFWYAPSLRINPEWFRELRIAGLHLFYPVAESLYIDYIRVTSVLRRRYIATSVQHRPVAAEELALPDLPHKDIEWNASN